MGSYTNKRTSVNIGASSIALTPATLTRDSSAEIRSAWHKFSWTNGMVTALGAVTTGNLKVCTLPAKAIVKSCIIRITGAAASITALTVSCGKTGTTYLDYVVASNAKAAANTIYGDAIAEVGAGLSDAIGSLGSITTTTDVYIQLISAVENLSAVTASAGEVYLEVAILP